MKAIMTKFRVSPPRIIAVDDDNNRVMVHQDGHEDAEYYHRAAAIALCEKMGWTGTLHGGHLQCGMVWVFQGEGLPRHELLTATITKP